MVQEHPQRRRLLRVLGGVLLLALVLLCYVQVVPFVRARFTTLLLPVLSEGLLYLQGDTAITALRASDGAVLWTHAIQRGPDTQSGFVELAVVSGSVYLPISTARVCALRASDGTTRWCTSPGSL